MAMDVAAGAESRPEQKTPAGWAKFFNKELKASQRTLRRWRRDAQKVVKEYVDDRAEGEDTWFKLNLFNANITTLKSMMYGNLPQVTVKRRFQDADDDIARVAANILERMLNNDLQENGDEYNVVLRGVLEDRLVPGLGCAVVRYDMQSSTIKTTVWDEDHKDWVKGEQEKLDWEDATVSYQYWGDVLYSWCRNWSEMRWVAFRQYLTKEQVRARFGEKWAEQLRYKRNKNTNEDLEGWDRDSSDSIDRAEIFEIWDKESGKVFWHQEDQDSICDSEDDPLELEGFFPCPPFFIANTSTTLYRPVSDFWMAKDLYREINRIETRIAMITEAVKVVGVYDKQQEGVQRMLKEGIENDLIPVDNWAMLAEKGGLRGVIEMFPALEVANTLERLVAQRNDAINLLYQVTGMSDILRGAATEVRTSATEQELKAKFASVRVQALQDEFARFCSDLMQIKCEIICKQFDAETIMQQANVRGLPQVDHDKIMPAINLIKNPDEMRFRVDIKPESVAMVDFAKKQQERGEYIQSLGFFLQSAAPIAEISPGSTATLLELLKWGLAGYKGADEIEGVLDAAIEELQQNPPQPQQNEDAAAAEQAKGQVEMMKAQAKMQELQMKMEHDREKHAFAMQQVMAKFEAEMTKIAASLEAALAQIGAQTEGKVTEQAAQTEGKVLEQAHATSTKIREMEASAELRPSAAE